MKSQAGCNSNIMYVNCAWK